MAIGISGKCVSNLSTFIMMTPLPHVPSGTLVGFYQKPPGYQKAAANLLGTEKFILSKIDGIFSYHQVVNRD